MKRSEIPRATGAVVGCYTVHLYCSHPEQVGFNLCWNHHDQQNEFTGTSEAACLAEARRRGWWISRADPYHARAVLCPFHAREVPR